MALSYINLIEVIIIVVLLRAGGLSTTCVEREEHIQRYLISSEPPYDNYYNISKAVYPSVDLPSLLIKITVTFLRTADQNITQGESFLNGSTANMNITNQTGLDASQITESEMLYTWSISCLYVSGGNISMTSMNWFSLGAIWPNRRERQLHLTLPQFCRGVSAINDTMIYFLSTLQDIAVAPNLPDPRLNTAECVIAGHGKASHFSGLKQLFHGVCWSILVISLVISELIASQWLIVQLRNWNLDKERMKDNQSKSAAVMLLSVIVFFGGIIINGIAWWQVRSTDQKDIYVCIFFGLCLFVLVRRVVWCICIHYNSNIGKLKLYKYFEWCLTKGHEEYTSKNAFSCFTLYPAVFMACHHLLWILLGIITEPFWGVTVLVSVTSVLAALFFLTYEFHKSFPSPECTIQFAMSVFLIPGGFFAFVLLIFVLFVVAQSFLSESLISTLVQNGLVSVAAVWFGYLKYDPGKKLGRGETAETPV